MSEVILVCDDERNIRRALRMVLEGDGLTVLEAESAPQALSMLASHEVDLLIMDVRMPGMSGIDALVELAKRPEAEGIPVVVISGHATIADAGSGLRAGQALAWPNTPCRGDIFHALRDLSQLVRFLDNRAYGVVEACDQQQRRMARAKRKRRGHTQSKRLALLRREQGRAITLADDVSVLIGWLREGGITPDGRNQAAFWLVWGEMTRGVASGTKGR
mgnify:CR=1 FL=1